MRQVFVSSTYLALSLFSVSLIACSPTDPDLAVADDPLSFATPRIPTKPISRPDMSVLTPDCDTIGVTGRYVLCGDGITRYEKLFGERLRSVNLGSTVSGSDVRYDFESCSEVDDDKLNDLNRVYFDQLGSLASYVTHHTTDGEVECDADEPCYLHVTTAHRGRSLTLSSDGIYECDSHYNQDGTEACRLLSAGPSTVNQAFVGSPTNLDGRFRARRGFVLIADEIRIQGRVRVGHSALVLIARDRIEMVDNAVLSSRWLNRGGPSYWAAATGPEGREPSKRPYGVNGYLEGYIQTGAPGHGGVGETPIYGPGPMVLITPRLDGRGLITAEGINGGKGGAGWTEGWPLDNPYGHSRVSNGGAGGAGGPGGAITVFTGYWNRRSVRVTVRGGSGGAGGVGAGGGADGARGARGPSGRSRRYRNFSFADMAFRFAGRGAVAAMRNARHHAKKVHLPGLDGPRHNAIASKLIRDLQRDYCDAGSIAEGAHAALCTEAEFRLARLLRDDNDLGLPKDFYMYVRPDIVSEMRAKVLETFDGLGSPVEPQGRFWRLETALVGDLADLEREIRGLEQDGDVAQREVGQRALATGIAFERAQNAAARLGHTMAQIERNAEEIVSLETQASQAVGRIEAALQPPSCDGVCWFGRIIDFASEVGSAIGAIARLDTATLWDGTKSLAGHLQAIESFDDLKSYFEYAKRVVDDSHLKDAVGGAKQLAAGVSALGASPEGVSANLAEIARLSMLSAEEIQSQLTDIYTVIASVPGNSDVTDAAAALGNLQTLVDLLQRMQALNRATPSLIEAHALAAAELRVAEAEVELARLQESDAEARAHFYGCTLGTTTSGCGGIEPVRTDAVVARASAMRNQACESARALGEQVVMMDYLLHRSLDFKYLDRTPDPFSHDLARNPMLLGTYEALQSVAPVVTDALFSELHGNGVAAISESVCAAGADDCRPRTPRSQYELNRIDYHDRVVRDLAGGRATFELSPNCEADVADPICHPALQAPGESRRRVIHFDVALSLDPAYEHPDGVPLVVDYAHGERATFDVGEDALADYHFAAGYARQTCEVVQAALGAEPLDVDCARLGHFDGVVSTPTADVGRRALIDANQLQISQYESSRLFGTSPRGRWTLDLRRTLRTLNAGDGCYLRRGGVDVACLPSVCDDPEIDAPAMCEVIEDDCDGDDLEVSACDAVCGPSCQALRGAIRGFEYRIYWTGR